MHSTDYFCGIPYQVTDTGSAVVSVKDRTFTFSHNPSDALNREGLLMLLALMFSSGVTCEGCESEDCETDRQKMVDSLEWLILAFRAGVHDPRTHETLDGIVRAWAHTVKSAPGALAPASAMSAVAVSEVAAFDQEAYMATAQDVMN